MQVLVAESDRLGECPIWDEWSHRLIWIDIAGRRLSSCNADGSDIRRRLLGEYPGSFALSLSGGMIIAFRRRIALFDSADNETASNALPSAQAVRERFNDCACDSHGRLYVSSMDARLTDRIGGLYRVDADLSLHRLAADIGVGNGIAWSPDERLLYQADTLAAAVYVYDFDIVTGSVENRRLFAQLGGTLGRPDGCGVDVDGFLWLATPEAGAVIRLDPAGRIERTLSLPVRYPTSVAFGGPSSTTLYVTSMQPPDTAPIALDGAVFARNVGIAGLRPARFAA